MREISRTRLLTPEEEVELVRRARSGDDEALDHLLRANLRFVVTVAKKYQGRGLSLADLINEGNYGLVHAAKRFDETRGFRFISYAVWWIRQAITRALTQQSRLVRLPSSRVHIISRVRHAEGRLQQHFGRPPTPGEISEELDMDLETVIDALTVPREAISMDTPFGDEDGATYMDFLSDEDDVVPDDHLIEESRRQAIEEALAQLPEREALVTRLFYGIGEPHAMSLEEIATQLNLSAERVRQLREKALLKLRWKHHGKLRQILHV